MTTLEMPLRRVARAGRNEVLPGNEEIYKALRWDRDFKREDKAEGKASGLPWAHSSPSPTPRGKETLLIPPLFLLILLNSPTSHLIPPQRSPPAAGTARGTRGLQSRQLSTHPPFTSRPPISTPL